MGVKAGKTQERFGPWAEGVPGVTQCPLLQYSQETHRFYAGVRDGDLNAPPGTYWYHSHTAYQRGWGLQGAMVIKDKSPPAQYRGVVDIPHQQTISLFEWTEQGDEGAVQSILVNGKSKLPNQTFGADEAHLKKVMNGSVGDFPTVETEKRIHPNIKPSYEEFSVKPGKIYRFRLIGMVGQGVNAIRFSIDGHTFSAIASDSIYIEEIKNLTYLWIASGERYDILLKTREDVSDIKEAFKMRFVMFNCIFELKAVCSIAWLRYEGQAIDTNYVHPHLCREGFDLRSPGRYPQYQTTSYPHPGVRSLNTPGASEKDWQERLTPERWRDPGNMGSIYPVDMRSLTPTDTSSLHSTQIIRLSRFYTSFDQIEMRSEFFPKIPYLFQDKRVSKKINFTDIPSNYNLSAYNFRGPHVLMFPYNPDLYVEIILYDDLDMWFPLVHPIHQHGGWFWVVGGGVYGEYLDRTVIMKDHKAKRLNYVVSNNNVMKDTIQVPKNGYVILRTKLDNPGFWLFHCHTEFHLDLGMALILQIGQQGTDWYFCNKD